ncbi:MAG: hypothetical protein HFE86_02460 [Clostridiales bacterium]|nr:hypothetical protein [Clostridiales bacterium]
MPLELGLEVLATKAESKICFAWLRAAESPALAKVAETSWPLIEKLALCLSFGMRNFLLF